MAKKRLCIVGGGASGLSLAWLATRQPRVRAEWDVTLLHDEPNLGGHSHTIPVTIGGRTVPVDIGVQFISPTVYPHVDAMLAMEDFRRRVPLTKMPPLRVAAAFTPELNWSTDERYQADPRFAGQPEMGAHAAELMRDIARCLWTKVDGKPAAGVSLEDYLRVKPHLREGAFFKFGLVPLLSVINGYTAHDILATRLGDLLPISTKLPFLAGPLIPFDQPGRGWYRFTHGAQSWVEAMADVARSRGARLLVDAPVRQVRPGPRPEVEWAGGGESFDAVVLTTDMRTNRALLEGAPGEDALAPYLSEERFPLLPGVCFIHQDDTILAPHLREEQHEDLQFTGAYAWAPQHDNPYRLPYDLHSTYATHFIHNAFPELPERCYVTMYAEAQRARFPAPEKVLHRKEWRHGRWMSSFFREGKEALHRVQGRHNLWFAGNNTTFDSEEGALLSALGVAEKLLDGFANPFGGLRSLARPHGIVLYRHFVRGIMFPDTWTHPA